MPDLNPKQKRFADEMQNMSNMSPMEALSSSLGSAKANTLDMATEAKKAILQRLKSPQMQQPYQRSPEEDLALKMKGSAAMEQSKASEAQNAIQRLQQETGDSEALQQFGEAPPDDLAAKKEMLRRYLLNNR